jgi:hypothetical protein
VREAVDAILQEKRYVTRAREIAEEFMRINTSDTLVRLLEEATLKRRRLSLQEKTYLTLGERNVRQAR